MQQWLRNCGAQVCEAIGTVFLMYKCLICVILTNNLGLGIYFFGSNSLFAIISRRTEISVTSPIQN